MKIIGFIFLAIGLNLIGYISSFIMGCDECKTCKDNKQGFTFCLNECYWPIDVLYEVEEKRNQEAADENDRKN